VHRLGQLRREVDERGAGGIEPAAGQPGCRARRVRQACRDAQYGAQVHQGPPARARPAVAAVQVRARARPARAARPCTHSPRPCAACCPCVCRGETHVSRAGARRFVVAAGLLFVGATVLWRSSGFTVGGGEAAPARPAESVAGTAATTGGGGGGGGGAPANRGATCAPWAGAETERTLATPWGSSIVVREYGSAGCPGVIMVHGANPSVVWEWDRTARELARRGMRVLLPNLHSGA